MKSFSTPHEDASTTRKLPLRPPHLKALYQFNYKQTYFLMLVKIFLHYLFILPAELHDTAVNICSYIR